MQTPYSDLNHPPTLFSRERRRERMLKFLETFDRRSWRAVGDIPFLVPLPKDDMRSQPAYAAGEDRD